MKTTNTKTNKMELKMKNQSPLKDGNKQFREGKLKLKFLLLIILFTSLSISNTFGQNAQSLNTNSSFLETAKEPISAEKSAGIDKEYAVARTGCDKAVCSRLSENTTFISNIIPNTNFVDISKRARKELEETWKCNREGDLDDWACLADINVYEFETRESAEEWVERVERMVKKYHGGDIIRIYL